VVTLRGRRAVVAKLGMDAHWRGAIVVANALRDAGMEVIYLGHATPSEVASVAVDEDVDLVGLSSLSGNHLTQCRLVVDALAQVGATDCAVVLGGTIPSADEPELEEMGVDAVFPTGTPLPSIIERLTALLAARRPART
jgi:methylmalonyl-CoA mutase C-terminal domain/subunit